MRSIAALLFASIVWGTINLILLSWILQVAEGIPIREFLADKGQWVPTLIVAFLSVGVAASFVALIEVAPILTVFTIVPTAILWYVYQAAQRRSEAVDRVRYMVGLSTTLASPQEPSQLLANAADNVRRFFGAESVIAIAAGRCTTSARDITPTDHPASAREQALVRVGDPHGADDTVDTAPGRVARGISDPPGPVRRWRVSPCAGHNLGHLGPRGADAVGPGGRYSWKLANEDRPVLASIAGSVSSALRASRLFLDLKDETAKLTAVVDHASDGIAVFDRAGRVVRWSPAMTTITGLRPTLESVPEADGLLADLAALRGINTGEDGLEQSIERPDGEHRDINVAVVAIADEADLSVMTVRDITQQRRVERMKSDFIATVSHELRTPITPIKGYAQLLSSRWDRMTPEKRNQVLATIEERANHLSRLVDDLLLASRASDVGHRQARREPDRRPPRQGGRRRSPRCPAWRHSSR